MKKLSTRLFCSLLLAFVLQVSAVAQTEPAPPKHPYRNTKVYDADLQIDGATLNKRLGKYYAENDLLAMKARKINQLNYVYLHSFKVIDYDNLPADVKNYIDQSFDIGLYDKFRKENENTVIEVDSEGRKFRVELFSRKE